MNPGGSGAPILVTGGTGFLGGALVRELLERRRPVHIFARRDSNREPLAGAPLVWHTGDLCDASSVEQAVRAVSEVADRSGTRAELLHGAALISYRSADRERAWAINVEGTRTVLAAARRHAIARLLHVSSVVSVGYAEDGRAIDEDAPFNGADLGVDYVTTKRAAEEAVLEAASELDVVIVNPGAIFGPSQAGGNSSRFLQAVRERRTGPLAPPGGLSVVGLEDTALGCLLALEKGTRGRRYILAERYLSAFELMRQVAIESGVRPVRWVVPRALWSAIGFAASCVDRLRPIELTSPQALRMLGLHFNLDASLARSELGWSPHPFPEVLRCTLAIQ